MAPHSSTLAWKIPWMEEPSRLQSMGLLRVRYDWVTSLSLFTFTHWRRKWQPTPVFLPGESRDGGAWWAAVYGAAQSRTWLKRLSSSSSSNFIFHIHRKISQQSKPLVFFNLKRIFQNILGANKRSKITKIYTVTQHTKNKKIFLMKWNLEEIDKFFFGLIYYLNTKTFLRKTTEFYLWSKFFSLQTLFIQTLKW